MKLLLSLFTVVVDVGLPITLYYVLTYFGVPDILALVLSGTIPFVSVIINFIFRNQVDVTGILSTTGFIASTILTIIQIYITLDILLQLNSPIISFAMGLVFFITLIPIKVGSYQMRPLLYHNFKFMEMGNFKGVTEDEPIPERWERHWSTYADFRQTFIVLTAVWGFALLLDVPFRILIIYKTKFADKAGLVGGIVTFCYMQIFVLFSVIYVKRMIKLHDKRYKEKEGVVIADAANNEF
ncbi:5950_t:CDS:1 [Dentiscutata erythropus]|uniref:5950_t:CDS:1 n=1 Tax=Dentiscutata erythropus TaxID=1348616 RepID=A0A9N9ADH2_9GLOM|nr:5950_t:CDS:1 [Dentiscutata erythropus]